MSSPAAAARSPTRSPRSPVTKQHAELSTSIEVDNDPHSDYESGLQSDTTSVSSSVFDFTYDNGRRYTKWGGDSKYMQPNDETEQDRLDMNHQ